LPGEVLVVAVNSMVKRQLGGSEYPKRRKQCEDAAAALGLETLRDATANSILALRDPGLLRRARHVVSDALEMGRLLLASHESLRDDYEVSCEELDFLVATASRLPCVFGARMTGGGFGGCTVNLIHRDHFEEFRDAIRAAYLDRYRLDPQVFACEAADGASIYPA
jgi:galactokinase